MADQVLTKQKLINADEDLGDLEEVLNGPPGKLIKTRLGREVYTLASVPQINTMTREEVAAAVAPKANKVDVNTALSNLSTIANKYYSTLAAANADIANIALNQSVTIGEEANSGLWEKKTAGATSLTKSPYDPLGQGKTYSEVQRKLGENNVTQMWFIEPYYEKVGNDLYFKPGLYKTTDNCFYVRDKRYPSHTITRTKFWEDLSGQVSPARYKVTSALGVTDCIALNGLQALLYDHNNKKIVLGERDTVGDYTVLIAMNEKQFGRCIEEDQIRHQLLSQKLHSEISAVSSQNPVVSTYKVKGIAHRGYSTEAPENTLPAYVLAKTKGFEYVECDVGFTGDDVPVLLHDETIDRTSTGTGTLSEMTLAQVKAFDYGSWKDAKYAGTQIPTLEEFLKLCRNLGLHPYLEIKNVPSATQARVKSIVAMVNTLGMKGKVSYISFDVNILRWVKAADPSARLGYLPGLIAADVDIAFSLKNGTNTVFVNPDKATITTEARVLYALSKGMAVECWTVNDASYVRDLVDKGISGITTDSLDIDAIIAASYT